MPLFLLLAWRIWAFTIRPRLYPHRLQYLPYWIPYLGHVIPFFRNSNRLYFQAKKFSPQHCTLRIAGQDIVLATTAAQISTIDKERRIFSFEDFMNLVYDDMAKVSPKNKPLLWRTPAQGYVSIFPNPKQLTCAHTGVELLHKQFHRPDMLRQFLDSSLAGFSQALQWNTLYTTSVLGSSPEHKVVSLRSLCRDAIVDAQVDSFFGTRLLELEPNLRVILSDWDTQSWRVIYQLPSALAKPATQPRDRLVDVLAQYYSLPAINRPGSVAFVNELYDDYKQAGLSTRDIAGIVFTILSGLSINPTMLAFWMLAHLLNNPTVIDQIREEIAPAMRAGVSNPELNGASLYELTKHWLSSQCSLLNSVFYETLRYTSTGSSIRKTTQATTLDGYGIPKGTIIAIPQRLHMMSEEAFGLNPSTFDYYRFQRDKSLTHKTEFRGFGGGTTLCSGRTAGRHMVLAFVAFVLWRYDIEALGPSQKVLGIRGKPFPQLDEATPSLGPGRPLDGGDLILKLTQRKV
ncbi:cytochrome P450 [Aspergillus homomorphus CBS 101889]|uniref:Putative cytochrome P450 n=1 Tax=Aspergillus homomorphus (strain CBS 101889) TaxID=1450537 RepID=A0A395HMF2_ASPHC|nr:putative cytochrome P450 [Aspergillus homomorphus CBS 101889]RAL08038.1 putative cytochrome P450 [Aspergillus homomorphus CBS 101889]